MQSKYTHRLKLCKLSHPHGPSPYGAWISWGRSPGPSAGTGSSTSPLTIHKVAGGYPCGEHHQKISSRIPQVHCVQIWRPKPHHRGQRGPIQKQTLLRVVREHRHPAMLCVCSTFPQQWTGREGKCRDPQGTQDPHLQLLEEAWCKMG